MNTKILIGFLLVGFVLVTTWPVLAQAVAPPAEPAAPIKILPGHPLYALKNFWRALKISLTTDPIKNIERRLALADQQLNDAKQFADRNKKPDTAIIQKILTRYAATIKHATTQAEKIPEDKRAAFQNRLTSKLLQQQATITVLKNILSKTGATIEIDQQWLEPLKQRLTAPAGEAAPDTTAGQPAEKTKEQRFLSCTQQCLDAGGTAALCEPDCKKQSEINEDVLKKLEWIESFRPAVKTPPIPPPPSDEEIRKQDEFVEQFLSQPKIQNYLKGKSNTAPAR